MFGDDGRGTTVSRGFYRQAQKLALDVDCSRSEPTTDALPHSFADSKSLSFLHFWTLSIQLTISCVQTFAVGHPVRERGRLVDRDGSFCGSIALDGHFLDPDRTGVLVELILLSECRDAMPGSELCEVEDSCRIAWDLYWVMLIQREEEGMIAERCGLGQIYQTAVNASLEPGPVWKEIVLG